MKIGLISDVHATVAPVDEALALFRKNNVDFTVCAGDIAGYGTELNQTVEALIAGNCHVITGNHDRWFINTPVDGEQEWIKEYFSSLPAILELAIEHTHLYAVHASPPLSDMNGIQLLDINGEFISQRRKLWQDYLEQFRYDVLVVGHTHQVFYTRLGHMLVINPGSTVFNHSCAILTLPELELEFFPLSGEEIQTVWNWSRMEEKYSDPESGKSS